MNEKMSSWRLGRSMGVNIFWLFFFVSCCGPLVTTPWNRMWKLASTTRGPAYERRALLFASAWRGTLPVLCRSQGAHLNSLGPYGLQWSPVGPYAALLQLVGALTRQLLPLTCWGHYGWIVLSRLYTVVHRLCAVLGSASAYLLLRTLPWVQAMFWTSSYC